MMLYNNNALLQVKNYYNRKISLLSLLHRTIETFSPINGAAEYQMSHILELICLKHAIPDLLASESKKKSLRSSDKYNMLCHC